MSKDPTPDEVVELVARAICESGTEEPGLCFRDDDPHEAKCIRSCVSCRNVARATIEALTTRSQPGEDAVTDAMVDAGLRASRSVGLQDAPVTIIYQAMRRAALNAAALPVEGVR